jgi:hypothetical protein
MTDAVTIKGLLVARGIPFYEKEFVPTNQGKQEPNGGTSVFVGEYKGQRFGERLPLQPHPGGYSGFFTEFVFDENGKLWAVWSWE